ncbi:MAG: response regulator [Lachnospiraceae bacterium]|nr:response regulator [Lachnospiraceae bacterium]
MEKKIRSKVNEVIEYLYDENVPMTSKKFYLVVGYVIPVLVLFMLISPFVRCTGQIVIMEFVFAMILCVFTYVLYRYNEYKIISYVMCFVTCILILPTFYLITGYIYNGIPVLLTSAVVLTFFVIEGKGVWVVAIIEFLYYGVLLDFSYNHRDMLNYYLETNCTLPEKIFNFVFACLVPVLIVAYQTALFNKTRVKKEQSYISIRNSELSKIRFLANMTHEIRNPMNSIVGMNELILKEDLTEGAREQAEVIREASSQLLRIVNNILIYSKLDSGKWDTEPVRYSFRDLMKDVIDNVSRSLQGDDADFFVFIDRTIPTYVFGDVQGIKQIFMYLLFNSIQQNQRRSMSLEIRSEKVTEEHTVRFKCRIAETGSGMADADVDSLLGAFNKYDSRRNATLKGLGLEISICNALLATMDGFLKIESVVGVGTAILFEFSNYIIDDTPMLTVDEGVERKVLVYLHEKDEEKVWKDLMEDIKISPVYAAGPVAFRNEIENHRYTHIFIWERDFEGLYEILSNTMCEDITYIITDYAHVCGDFGKCKVIRKPVSCLNMVEVLNGEWKKEEYMRTRSTERFIYPEARVLIVDDSLVNQKVMCSVLGDFEIYAKTASSGRECLEILKDYEFDLILLDQRMPEMDGIETLRRIRQIPGKNAKAPVLCITAELGRDVKERLLSAGFDDYIAKPVKDYHLGRLLRNYLPDEMAVVVTEEAEGEVYEPVREVKPPVDPTVIDVHKGTENVGGAEDVYYSVLNTYYNEGVDKLEAIPGQFMDGDISLFTTNVHALKSSSASVGALNISERFRALEFAGKDNDRKFIEENLDPTLRDFRELLVKVKQMLVEKGVFEGHDKDEDPMILLELEELDVKVMNELQQSLNNVNLKRCEEIIGELTGHNYGDDINANIRKMKEAYDMFDYHTVKETVKAVQNIINGG